MSALAAPVGASAPQPASGTTKASRSPRRASAAAPYLLLAPTVATLAVLTGWPLVKLIVTSTQRYGRAQVFGSPADFVGLDNYRAVLSDPQFWTVLGRSVLFCAANVVLTMTLGMLVAVLLTKVARAIRLLVSVGLLLAWAMPSLTSTVIWGWMFDTQYGVVNWLLTRAGLDYTGHSWLINPLSFFAVATVVVTWQSVPFVGFTLYAALTQVPEDVLEAAELDGAGGWQRFRRVAVPFIRPILLVVTMLQVIWDLRVFTQIFALQDVGGITAKTSTIGVYIYQVGVAQGRFDVGSAIAVIMVLVMLVASFGYVRKMVRAEQL